MRNSECGNAEWEALGQGLGVRGWGLGSRRRCKDAVRSHGGLGETERGRAKGGVRNGAEAEGSARPEMSESVRKCHPRSLKNEKRTHQDESRQPIRTRASKPLRSVH